MLCAVQFFGYGQHFVLQPTFPLYIIHLGGSPFVVGLVIASFGVAYPGRASAIRCSVVARVV